jgi:2-(1,2-epoxy-1,2-dihydrophenyl)acetyl-CoA isomerase
MGGYSMGFQFIRFEKKNNIGTIQLNMPEKMNALEEPMFQELESAARSAGSDPDVKCLIITGSGKAFCSGGDVKRFSEGFSLMEGHEYVKHFYPFARYMINMEKPTISAVNGYALGAGFCLALMCDIVYASKDAKFGMAFKNVGLVPDLAGMFFLPRLIGLSKSKELTFTGRNIGAEEAEKIGLVSRIFDPECFLESVEKVAEDIAAGPGFAFKEAKAILNQSQQISLEELLTIEAYAQGMCFQSEDSKEGALAFAEKRKPVFKGK